MRKSFGSSTTKSLASMLSRNAVTGGPDSYLDLNTDDKDDERVLKCPDRVVSLFDKKKRVYRKSVNIKREEEDEKEGANFAKNFTEVLIVQAKRNKKQQSKGSQVANLLLFLTVSFVIATVPYSTFYALKLNLNLLNAESRNILINILSLLQYLRHAANFLIYLATSSIIKNEFKLIFNELKRAYRQRFG
jgi:hypothetical protein